MLWKSKCQRAIATTSQLARLNRAVVHLRPEVTRRLKTGVFLFLVQRWSRIWGYQWEENGEKRRGAA